MDLNDRSPFTGSEHHDTPTDTRMLTPIARFLDRKNHDFHEINQELLYRNRLVKSIFFLIILTGSLTLNTFLLSLFYTQVITGYHVFYGIQVFMLISVILAVIILPYHPRHYGFNLNRLQFNILSGLGVGLLGLAATVLLRVYLVRMGITAYTVTITPFSLIDGLLYYPVIVLVQESMTKGFFQSYFVAVFESTSINRILAIGLGSLIFAQFHLFYGLPIFVFTFVFNCLTGWLYERSRSLVGVWIIHYLMGMGLFFGCSLF